MFNQIWILWALPLVLVPLIIHLLNRLRFQRVEWAAMPFLKRATKHSTSQAKLRQFFILAARMASILFLILALSRPLVGGWMGLALSSPPETIIILLDRSASMENRDAATGRTRRETALELMSSALKLHHTGARVVLIENVSAKPEEISADILQEVPQTQATDSGADILRMLESALDYMLNQQTGKTELWIASDLQRSNWAPDNSRWAAVTEQIRALSDKRGVMVRLMALENLTPGNTAVTMEEVVRFRSQGRSFVDLTFSLQRFEDGVVKVPVSVELEGKSVAEQDVVLETTEHRVRKRLELPPDTGATWGQIVIPDDQNNTDNQAYFVLGNAGVSTTGVFSSSKSVSARLALAAAPAPDSLKQRAQVLAREELSTMDLASFALIIWHGSFSNAQDNDVLINYVRKGGFLLCFPDSGEGGSLGNILSWSELENWDKEKPYTISHWDNSRGPLADSLDGKALAVDRLETMIRRVPVLDGEILAEFGDSATCLVSRTVGLGRVVACATVPSAEWSNLGDGPVLVPMVQRLLRLGAGRLSAAALVDCGSFKVPDGEQWDPVVKRAQRHAPDTRAGVYSFGNRLLAVNRPEIESTVVKVQADRLETLFSGLSFKMFSESANAGDKALPSETWRLLLYAMLVVVLVEGLLVLPPKRKEGA